MDFLYGHDRKFSDFEDPDMTDMLGPDMFATSSMGVDDSFMTLPTLTESDNDWFNSIFDDQGLVYNDKNLGETATQPCIKSEHSYSANNVNRSSPLNFVKMDESDTAIFNTHGSTLDLTQKAQLIHAAATATQPHCIKTELPDNDPLLTAMTSTDTSTTLTRPATIILATTTSSTTQEFSNSPQAVFPTTTVQIKTEPMDAYETLQEQTVNLDTVIMPPTPPSSAGSDSDGSQSPQRSAPNSPQRQSPVRLYHYHHLHHASSPDTSTCAAQTLSQPLFLSPVSQSCGRQGGTGGLEVVTSWAALGDCFCGFGILF